MKKAKPTYTTVHWKSLDDPDKFRDADRIEEAQRIPLTETQKMDADYLKSLEDAAKDLAQYGNKAVSNRIAGQALGLPNEKALSPKLMAKVLTGLKGKMNKI